MTDRYSMDDLKNDLDFLVRKGLIEVSGITDDGQWLYKATEASLKMTEEEREALIKSVLDEETE